MASNCRSQHFLKEQLGKFLTKKERKHVFRFYQKREHPDGEIFFE